MRWWLVALLVPLAGCVEEPPVDDLLLQDLLIEDAAPAPVHLYAHLDGFQDFPMSIFAPPEGDATAGFGAATHSFSCAGTISGLGLATSSYHTWYGFFTPDAWPEGSKDRFGHDEPTFKPARGIRADLHLDPAGSLTAVWFLETRAVGGMQEGREAPLAIPNVVVRAQMRLGDDIGVGDGSLNAGALLAEGRTEPAHLSPITVSGHPHVSHVEVPGRHVYRFEVPMSIEATEIPLEESFNLRVDAFVENPACNDPSYPGDEMIMPNLIAAHSAGEHRPGLSLPVANPLGFDYLQIRPQNDTYHITARLGSPFGADDLGTVNLWVEGPDGRTPVEGSTWQASAPGDYVLVGEATNLQGTATAYARAAFTVS